MVVYLLLTQVKWVLYGQLQTVCTLRALTREHFNTLVTVLYITVIIRQLFYNMSALMNDLGLPWTCQHILLSKSAIIHWHWKKIVLKMSLSMTVFSFWQSINALIWWLMSCSWCRPHVIYCRSISPFILSPGVCWVFCNSHWCQIVFF